MRKPDLSGRWRRLAGLCVLALLSGTALALARPTNDRPNILIILADDMGYADPGFIGGDIDTPNLDRLARDGLLFTAFYNETKCTPTRASLLTGHTSRGLLERGGEGPTVDEHLRRDVPTLGDRLRQVGYSTHLVGKWHLGASPEDWPYRRGFDQAFGLITGASSYFEMRMREDQDNPERRHLWPPKPFMVANDQIWQPPAKGFYMTDAITDRAVATVQAQKGAKAPFLIYLAYTAPHWPLHALDTDIAKYKGRFDAGWDVVRQRRFQHMKDKGLLPADAVLPPLPEKIPAWDKVENKAEWARRMEVYAAQLDRMDQGVGRVLKALEETGQRDNTIIFFLSDNGASAEPMGPKFGYDDPSAPIGSAATNTAYKEPWAAVSNTPYRRYKRFLYEGGIRTPMVVNWPAGLERKGQVTTAFGHVADLLPTALDLAGAPPANDPGITGQSLRPAFTDPAFTGHQRYFWSFNKERAVRDGVYKLVSSGKDGRWELYDVVADPTESRDLAAAQPERVATMAAAWQQWADAHPADEMEGGE